MSVQYTNPILYIIRFKKKIVYIINLHKSPKSGSSRVYLLVLSFSFFGFDDYGVLTSLHVSQLISFLVLSKADHVRQNYEIHKTVNFCAAWHQKTKPGQLCGYWRTSPPTNQTDSCAYLLGSFFFFFGFDGQGVLANLYSSQLIFYRVLSNADHLHGCARTMKFIKKYLFFATALRKNETWSIVWVLENKSNNRFLCLSIGFFYQLT